MPQEFNPISQDCGIAVNNKRIGTAVNATVSIDRGAERLENDQGYGGHGRGTEKTSVKITTIVYKEGLPYDPHQLLMDAINTGAYVTVTSEIAGELYSQIGVMTALEVSYDAVKRTATGNWSWEGGNRQKV